MEDLLPYYLNGTLTPAEREAVEAWLKETPGAEAALAAQQRLLGALQAQPESQPSPAVLAQTRTRLGLAQVGQAQTGRPSWAAWVFGAFLTLAVLMLSWAVLRPGVILEWSVENPALEKFRVYRAVQPDAKFDLLEEVAASPSTGRYTFVDDVILPAQPYVYRVEVVGQEGSTSSQVVAGDTLAALLTQLAVLLASLVIGYSGVLLLQVQAAQGRRSGGLAGLLA